VNLSREIVRQIESIVGQCAPEGVEVNVSISKASFQADRDYLIQLEMRSGNRTKTLIQDVKVPFDTGTRQYLERLAAAFATGANELARKMLVEIDNDPRFYSSQQERAQRARSQAEQHLDDEIAALERLL
jgi:hypothetical protein